MRKLHLLVTSEINRNRFCMPLDLRPSIARRSNFKDKTASRLKRVIGRTMISGSAVASLDPQRRVGVDPSLVRHVVMKSRCDPSMLAQCLDWDGRGSRAVMPW
jgi:DNA-binding transcriptional regulator/RsmH inhibitor MraZ